MNQRITYSLKDLNLPDTAKVLSVACNWDGDEVVLIVSNAEREIPGQMTLF